MDLCQLYDQMRSKQGWNDGDAQPIGAYEARDALVRLINRHLPESSPVEAYGFDRPGMHNGALILFRHKESLPDEFGYCGEEEEPGEIDEILSDAQDAEELGISLILRVKFEVI